MRLSHHIQYCFLLAFAKLLCALPRPLALSLGAQIGKLGWALRARRQLALANIARARPEASPAELRRIGARSARNFGRTIAEFIRYGIKDRDLVTELVDIDGLDKLETGLSKGKGAILLTGHLGAWAIYFAAIALRGIPLALLVGKQHNAKVDTFIHKIPGDRVEFIPKGRTAIKTILGKLNDNRAVVMVADQHAGKTGIMSPFLGAETPTLALPGSFAVKYEAPVFTMAGHRLPDGRHSIVIDELKTRPVSTPDEMKIEIVRAYNEWMGDQIKRHADQYFWYHRRWRAEDRPDAERSTPV